MTIESEEQKKLSSFLMLAEQADQAGNHQEALSFYTKALEIEPLNPDAWFGKGKAAGWCSTVGKSRLLEMVQGISNAIKFAPEERRADLSVQGAIAINRTANALYNAAYQLYKQDINSRKICWTAFEECLRSLDAAHDLNPKSIKLMESILIFVNNLGPIFGASDAQKQYSKELQAKYQGLVKELDPNYKPPASSCFVVTATMGGESNIFVSDFRCLRDGLMVRYRPGKAFVNWYYKYGPYAARFIEKRPALRLAAFVLIILPAYLVAKPILLVLDKS